MNNQNIVILRHLCAGKTITAAEAFVHFRVQRLSARIKDLRDAGHKINTIMHRDHANKYVARYALHSPVATRWM